jgi:hypothetical protein
VNLNLAVTVDLVLVTNVPQDGKGYREEHRTGNSFDGSVVFVFFLDIVGQLIKKGWDKHKIWVGKP